MALIYIMNPTLKMPHPERLHDVFPLFKWDATLAARYAHESVGQYVCLVTHGYTPSNSISFAIIYVGAQRELRPTGIYELELTLPI